MPGLDVGHKATSQPHGVQPNAKGGVRNCPPLGSEVSAFLLSRRQRHRTRRPREQLHEAEQTQLHLAVPVEELPFGEAESTEKEQRRILEELAGLENVHPLHTFGTCGSCPKSAPAPP